VTEFREGKCKRHGNTEFYACKGGGCALCIRERAADPVNREKNRVRMRQRRHENTAYKMTEYKRNAKVRGIVWEITSLQFTWLVSSPCIWCARTPSGGVDRVKNEYGYTQLNSVACCKACNYMKRDHTAKEFITFVAATAAYSPSYPVFKVRWTATRAELASITDG